MTIRQRKAIEQYNYRVKGDKSHTYKSLFSAISFCLVNLNSTYWQINNDFTWNDAVFLGVCEQVQNRKGYFSKFSLRSRTIYGSDTVYSKMSRLIKYGYLGEDKDKKGANRFYVTKLGKQVLKAVSRIITNFVEDGTMTYAKNIVKDPIHKYTRWAKASPATRVSGDK